jgi:hypothetical protein
MDSIFEALGALQGQDAVRTLSRTLGTDEGATGGAVAAALPVLIGALSRNASTREGSQALSSALGRHDGGILGDLMGALGGGASQDGSAILGHLLGARRGSVETQLGRSTGLDAGSVQKLLATLAPLVLGALGSAQRKQGLDADGLGRALGQERERVASAAPEAMSTFERLLDSDGDGEIGDDVARLGGQLLGSLFSGRR